LEISLFHIKTITIFFMREKRKLCFNSLQINRKTSRESIEIAYGLTKPMSTQILKDLYK